MATQNSTITVKGKLGNIVGYKGRDGKRLARIRQTEVKNPKTEGQVIQRMIMATASKAYGRMKSICDHSFQGINYGAPSQSYFLKRAMEDIRKFVALSLPEFPETLRNDPRAFVGLAEPESLANAGVGLLISQGTIPSVPVRLNTPAEGAEPVVEGFGSKIATDVEQQTIQVFMNALGAKVGYQMTFVGIKQDGSFAYTRLIVKTDATSEQLNASMITELQNFMNGQESVFDNKSEIGDVVPGTNKGNIIITDKQGTITQAGAVILSSKEGDVWQRSTQRLVWLSDAGDFSPNFADNVLPMWQTGTTEINTENPYYLNNAKV